MIFKSDFELLPTSDLHGMAEDKLRSESDRLRTGSYALRRRAEKYKSRKNGTREHLQRFSASLDWRASRMYSMANQKASSKKSHRTPMYHEVCG